MKFFSKISNNLFHSSNKITSCKNESFKVFVKKQSKANTNRRVIEKFNLPFLMEFVFLLIEKKKSIHKYRLTHNFLNFFLNLIQ